MCREVISITRDINWRDDYIRGIQIFNLECDPINSDEFSLKRDEYYIIDGYELSISEVILSPVRIDVNYKIVENQDVEFTDIESRFSIKNDNAQLKSVLECIIGFNTLLPISQNLSKIEYLSSSDRVITIYFYPICYRIEGNFDCFYTLKSGHQFNGLFCDGIYEIRVAEWWNVLGSTEKGKETAA